VLSFILTAYAQEDSAEPIDGFIGDPKVDSILSKILTDIISPALGLVTVFALAWFMYGVVRFIMLKDKNPDEMERGKKHLVYGGVGLFIITSLWGIMGFLADMTDSNVWFR
jgi:hypothetical protein